ncbi:hypothetical protein GCM10022205_39460 [Spinactinospora alkalitolerans]
MSVLVPPNLVPLAAEDPRTVGPYVVIGRIGSGRTGTVYAAVNPTVASDAVLAVKTLHSSHLTDDWTRAELERRLHALSAVDGRCYVPPVAFDAYATPPWLAMPYTSGVPLAQYARKRGAMGAGRLIALAAGIAEGLQALHGSGLAHGDLKPSNILLSSSGPRILDCALPGDATALRQSAAWMSPERHRGEPPSQSGDVFAWGAVVAFAATGRLPFGLGEPEVLAARVADTEPDLDGVPADLVPLLRRALSKQAGARPSVRELLGAAIAVWERASIAEAAEHGVPGTAVTRLLSREWQGIVEPAWLPRVIHLDGAPSGGRGRVPLVVGGAALALALIGGGIWAGVSALTGGGAAEQAAADSTPSASPAPEGPRTAVVRFGEVPQPDPVDGPWVYTEVERVEEGAAAPTGEIPTQQEWSGQWEDAEASGDPLEARIAPDAEVLCARFCLTPGQLYTDEEGRGTFEVTGQDFINYLSWGDVVIAEVTYAEEETEDGLPEIVRITELYRPADR